MVHRKKRVSFGSVMKEIGHSVGSVATHVEKPIDNVIKMEGKLGSQALHTVGGLGQSLMLPLILIGGVAVIYVINK